MIRKIVHKLILLVLGGSIYAGLEIIVRGYTHPSMVIVGGICFVIISVINDIRPELSVREQSLMGASIICIVEFMAGCILNLGLGLHIWQYHTMDLLGQTSIPAWFMWLGLTPLGLSLSSWLEWDLRDEPTPKFGLFRSYIALIFGDNSKYVKFIKK